MIGLLSLFAVSAFAAAPAPEAPLAEVLKKLSDEELRKDRETCSYKESSVVEELSAKNEVLGSVTRNSTVVRRPDRIDRKLVKKEKHGEVSSAFEAEPKRDPDERKQLRNAFHPDEQQLFHFEMLKTDEKRMVIRFAPLEKNSKKMKGSVEVDIATGTLRSMTAEPSELPTFMHEMAFEIAFGDTSCGVQPTRMTMHGSGGALFINKRFRMATQFVDFEATKTSAQ